MKGRPFRVHSSTATLGPALTRLGRRPVRGRARRRQRRNSPRSLQRIDRTSIAKHLVATPPPIFYPYYHTQDPRIHRLCLLIASRGPLTCSFPARRRALNLTSASRSRSAALLLPLCNSVVFRSESRPVTPHLELFTAPGLAALRGKWWRCVRAALVWVLGVWNGAAGRFQVGVWRLWPELARCWFQPDLRGGFSIQVRFGSDWLRSLTLPLALLLQWEPQCYAMRDSCDAVSGILLNRSSGVCRKRDLYLGCEVFGRVSGF